MIDRAFAPGFRMRLHQKDLRLALDSAAELGVAQPNTTQTAELMRSCASRPGGDEADHSSLILALEALATNPPAKAKE
jgi:2-hydroxy-3-oxopropionate reductase